MTTVFQQCEFSSDGTILATAVNGIVKVFKLLPEGVQNAGSWVQYGDDITDVEAFKFGRHLNLSNNGNYLAVGSCFLDNSINGIGVLDIYQYQPGLQDAGVGGTWIRRGSRIIGESTVDAYFYTSSFNQTNTRVAVIGQGFNVEDTRVGSLRVYEYDSNVTDWVLIQQIDTTGNGELLDLSQLSRNTENIATLQVVTDENTRDLQFLRDERDNFNMSTGLVSGGHLSVSQTDNTKFRISSGRGQISYPYISTVEWSDIEDIEIDTLGQAGDPLIERPFTHIYIDMNGDIIQSLAAVNTISRRERIYIGKIVHNQDNGTIALAYSQPEISTRPANTFNDFIGEISNVIVLKGLLLKPYVNLQMTLTEGKLYGVGINYGTNELTPNVKNIFGVNGVPFAYRLRNGIELPGTTSIDPNKFELTTGELELVSTDYWTNQRIYVFPSGNIRIQMGEQEYPEKEDAANAITAEVIEEANIRDNAVLLCILTIQQGATNLFDGVFTQADHFGELGKGGAPSGVGSSGFLTMDQTFSNDADGRIQLTDIKTFGITDTGGIDVFEVDLENVIVPQGRFLRIGTITDAETTILDKLDFSGVRPVIFRESDDAATNERQLEINYQALSISNEVFYITPNLADADSTLYFGDIVVPWKEMRLQYENNLYFRRNLDTIFRADENKNISIGTDAILGQLHIYSETDQIDDTGATGGGVGIDETAVSELGSQVIIENIATGAGDAFGKGQLRLGIHKREDGLVYRPGVIHGDYGLELRTGRIGSLDTPPTTHFMIHEDGKVGVGIKDKVPLQFMDISGTVDIHYGNCQCMYNNTGQSFSYIFEGIQTESGTILANDPSGAPVIIKNAIDEKGAVTNIGQAVAKWSPDAKGYGWRVVNDNGSLLEFEASGNLFVGTATAVDENAPLAGATTLTGADSRITLYHPFRIQNNAIVSDWNSGISFLSNVSTFESGNQLLFDTSTYTPGARMWYQARTIYDFSNGGVIDPADIPPGKHGMLYMGVGDTDEHFGSTIPTVGISSVGTVGIGYGINIPENGYTLDVSGEMRLKDRVYIQNTIEQEDLLIIGEKNQHHLSIDGNEILARVGDISSTLYLQANKGLLDVNGETLFHDVVVAQKINGAHIGGTMDISMCNVILKNQGPYPLVGEELHEYNGGSIGFEGTYDPNDDTPGNHIPQLYGAIRGRKQTDDSHRNGMLEFFVYDNNVNGSLRNRFQRQSMVINSNGFVGINTSTPGVFLDVNGPAQINATAFPFTGSHITYLGEKIIQDMSGGDQLIDEIKSWIEEHKGMLVSVTGRMPTISLQNSWPEIELSRTMNDAKVFGVVGEVIPQGDFHEPVEVSIQAIDPITGEIMERMDKDQVYTEPIEYNVRLPRVLVQSVGEGAIWVCNSQGVPKIGDLLTSASDISGVSLAGYAAVQRENPDEVNRKYVEDGLVNMRDLIYDLPIDPVKRSYTIARTTMAWGAARERRYIHSSTGKVLDKFELQMARIHRVFIHEARLIGCVYIG